MYSRVLRHISGSDLRALNEDLTLKFRDELNPMFWKGDTLKGVIKTALMKFANAFAEYVELDNRAIKDVLMLGGNAGYNYTQHSDIDVHIVVDPKYVPGCDPELLDDYYMDKKTLWELTHNVTIYGVKAEPYIERPKVTRKKSQGVYSLLKKSWIQEPTRIEGDVDEKDIEKKVNNFKSKIDALIKNCLLYTSDAADE